MVNPIGMPIGGSPMGPHGMPPQHPAMPTIPMDALPPGMTPQGAMLAQPSGIIQPTPNDIMMAKMAATRARLDEIRRLQAEGRDQAIREAGIDPNYNEWNDPRLAVPSDAAITPGGSIYRPNDFPTGNVNIAYGHPSTTLKPHEREFLEGNIENFENNVPVNPNTGRFLPEYKGPTKKSRKEKIRRDQDARVEAMKQEELELGGFYRPDMMDPDGTIVEGELVTQEVRDRRGNVVGTIIPIEDKQGRPRYMIDAPGSDYNGVTYSPATHTWDGTKIRKLTAREKRGGKGEAALQTVEGEMALHDDIQGFGDKQPLGRPQSGQGIMEEAFAEQFHEDVTKPILNIPAAAGGVIEDLFGSNVGARGWMTPEEQAARPAKEGLIRNLLNQGAGALTHITNEYLPPLQDAYNKVRGFNEAQQERERKIAEMRELEAIRQGKIRDQNNPARQAEEETLNRRRGLLDQLEAAAPSAPQYDPTSPPAPGSDILTYEEAVKRKADQIVADLEERRREKAEAGEWGPPQLDSPAYDPETGGVRGWEELQSEDPRRFVAILKMLDEYSRATGKKIDVRSMSRDQILKLVKDINRQNWR
tara:strand:+ start:19890 stop:21653 length:1764 start_codon:yes stop_codon:yes gene_type:complete